MILKLKKFTNLKTKNKNSEEIVDKIDSILKKNN